MCKFNVAGYSNTCKEYDETVLITKTDIALILQRINEKRSFIASGIGKKLLPHAANMRKIIWSDELAKSAQRWADQCDSRTNAEDDCRNLESVEVGQCVASISGATSGLNVKSFIDSWFMTSMTYRGSVSYYNHTSDYGSRQFTQLIWAATNEVGCGRAKFQVQVHNRSKSFDRLVCNFAPSGNVHSEIVYAIGFPATQCPKGTAPDSLFIALCANINNYKATSAEPISRILRILNLNDTTQHDIEQLQGYGLKKNNRYEINNNRHPRIRHVSPHESLGYMIKNKSPVEEFWTHKNMVNKATSATIFTKIRHLKNSLNDNTRSETKHIRMCTRHKPAESTVFSKSLKLCTRQNIPTEKSSMNPTYKLKCTRKNCPLQTTCTCDPLSDIEDYNNEHIIVPEPYEPIYQKHKLNNYNSNNRRKFQQRFNNIAPHLDSGNTQTHGDKIDYVLTNYREPQKIKLIRPNNFKPNAQLFSKNTRTKRQFSQDEIKRFWQQDYAAEKQKQLKSLRYTTLPRKKGRKLTTSLRRPIQETTSSTESITIIPKAVVPTVIDHYRKIPEKYLSFEELMTLRNKNIENNEEISRRKYDEKSTTNGVKLRTEDSEATTLFSKINHCTRKLTCTWTAPTIHNSTARPGRGSRTPPGYVEGCTRTSTCTREYLERNKMPGEETESPPDEQDEDYCEKRSLKVRRRNLGEKEKPRINLVGKGSIEHTTQPMNTELPLFENGKHYLKIKQDNESYHNSNECVCSDN